MSYQSWGMNGLCVLSARSFIFHIYAVNRALLLAIVPRCVSDASKSLWTKM